MLHDVQKDFIFSITDPLPAPRHRPSHLQGGKHQPLSITSLVCHPAASVLERGACVLMPGGQCFARLGTGCRPSLAPLA